MAISWRTLTRTLRDCFAQRARNDGKPSHEQLQRGLLRFDARGLDHLHPLRDFGLDNAGKLLRRVTDRL